MTCAAQVLNKNACMYGHCICNISPDQVLV
jgi:hypothetical protein